MATPKQNSLIRYMRDQIKSDKKHKYVAAAEIGTANKSAIYCSIVSADPLFETKSPLSPANLQEKK